MVDVNFYFQVHQPFRLRHYTIFDIGSNSNYFDHKKNIEILNRVAKKCYIPANNILLHLLEEIPEFKISYSFSGVLLEQLASYLPDVLSSFQELADTKKVEILGETQHHSLAFLHSKKEFTEQINIRNKLIKKLFSQAPKVFRNTELIYNNEIAKIAEDIGYKGILAEGWESYLGWRSPNFVYEPINTKNIKLLLKNYRLSDDIAFRFSNHTWNEFPLTAEKYASWISKINGNGQLVNLFMDYETFGEHQWPATGIFKFLKQLPGEILKHKDSSFITPSHAIKKYPAMDKIDIPHYLSWADMERDLSAWQGNKMQQEALRHLHELEPQIKASKDKKLLEDWRKLQTSDHFYYMCTKYFNDGDVHKYFNPYDTPYDAFITFMNILNDIKLRIHSKR